MAYSLIKFMKFLVVPSFVTVAFSRVSCSKIGFFLLYCYFSLKHRITKRYKIMLSNEVLFMFEVLLKAFLPFFLRISMKSILKAIDLNKFFEPFSGD